MTRIITQWKIIVTFCSHIKKNNSWNAEEAREELFCELLFFPLSLKLNEDTEMKFLPSILILIAYIFALR